MSGSRRIDREGGCPAGGRMYQIRIGKLVKQNYESIIIESLRQKERLVFFTQVLFSCYPSACWPQFRPKPAHHSLKLGSSVRWYVDSSAAAIASLSPSESRRSALH